MTSSRKWHAVLILLAAVVLSGVGCASSAQSMDASEELSPPAELLVAPGTPDLENSHLPSVMVNASIITQQGRLVRRACSGVIVHPRLVFTAAHCVCAPRNVNAKDLAPRPAGTSPTQGERKPPRALTRASALTNLSITSIVDGASFCALTATVTTARYTSSKQEPDARPDLRDHPGAVVVHPAFELVSGKRGSAQGVVWSNADLAAIFLEKPLAPDMPQLQLAEAEVSVGDAITMVGYASGDDVVPDYGVRHFGDNRVSQLIRLETGSAVFRTEEQPSREAGAPAHAQAGDSGGGCVQSRDKNSLVGISSVGAQAAKGGRMSIFTSVYSHRSWLLQMLKKADES